ncbi:hypothetical protein CC1G_14951 [Coprinopsis cinerea okayama7|uniref:DUF676 domain-containing protein n=1 Tax=Coprinopsis cinerea (strain Okayama-7 / 130 / ATCC MYA-4618 / FGSC 9003) TaxID=240176 RepID=D6RP45_COPC7|nr:hypothetical protein CC1G_14951 [Coprinopsis cinerea okayama7\|eukprot:XP_002910620.1 hypothetical protein CC1G_14951 [Coprinopsis cinerea okayama7\
MEALEDSRPFRTLKAKFDGKYPGKSNTIRPISLATGLDGRKVATVTFRKGKILRAALGLRPEDRVVEGCDAVGIDDEFHGLTPLNDGGEMDIVAIHGLNGHAFDTWCWRQHAKRSWCSPREGLDDSVMWFRDHPVDRIGQARAKVWVYGYNANSKRRRPLVLIAHSMGGLVIKQAMIWGALQEDKEWPHFLNVVRSIRGIMFFGAPHRGGNGVPVGRLVATLRKMVNLEARTDLIELLKKDSSTLDDLSDTWKNIVDQRNLELRIGRNVKFDQQGCDR